MFAALSGVVLLLGAAGCAANNGELFTDDVVAPGDEPSVDPEPAEPEPEPAAAPADPEAPPGPSESGPDDDLPLTEPPSSPEPDGEPPEVGPGDVEPPAPAGPAIIAVSPEDGARGVSNDAPIVIGFSEPMDRASTEAAYQSELMPSRSVAFAWNESSTELTITPGEPVEYGVGEAPELAEARRVSFFISASATSADGQSLAQPYESSFSLLRQVVFAVAPLADRGLSGNYRSDDSYGAGACAEDESNMCVGDVRAGRQSDQYKGFISFEMAAALPADLVELQAELRFELSATAGNPFAGLGNLLLEHVSFGEIGLEAFDSEPLDVLGPIASAGDAGAEIRADVSASLLSDLSVSDALSQYRLAFEDATDADVNSDAIVSALETQRLDVSFLLP